MFELGSWSDGVMVTQGLGLCSDLITSFMVCGVNGIVITGMGSDGYRLACHDIEPSLGPLYTYR